MSKTPKPPDIGNEIGVVALPFVPVPPNLEVVLGYCQNRRHVAFYWSNEDEALCYTDGVHSACGSGYTNASGWHLFVTHPRVAAALSGINVYGEPEANHALVLDRTDRRMFTATIEDARDVLLGNHVEKREALFPTVPLLADDFLRGLATFAATEELTAEDIYARAEAKRQAEQLMLDWLNQPDPQLGRRPREGRAS